MTCPNIIAAALGISLFAWCTLVVYSASRSVRLRERRSLAALQRSLEAALQRHRQD